MKPVKTVGIVSLSSGIIGEEFVQHEVALGVRRLEAYGLTVKFLPHARKGIEFVKAHPELRAADLLSAFRDPEIDLILTSIGGDDTYRLLPYLFDHDELKQAAAGTDKLFLGFSDTTINHLMLHKAGVRSFYGQAFLTDLCEPGAEIPPYTRRYFEELIATGGIAAVTPSGVWYESRPDFGPEQLGVPLVSHRDRGFALLQGPGRFSGEILGGCIDTLFDIFDGERYADMPPLCQKYGLFPSPEDWKGKILLLESSEEKMPPEKYRRALLALKNTGIFKVISGVLAGKPMDEAFDEEYRKLLVEIIGDPDLPILCNLNIGHAAPRCILPFGVEATVDAERQRIEFAAD